MSKKIIVCVITLLMVTAVSVSAQNLLLNPGFENGPAGGVSPTDWTAFGNAYQEGSYDPFYPHSGTQLCSMYGNWSGPYNVSGIFQEFTCSEGDEYEMACWARYSSNDPMIGSQAEGGNWMVQKIAFFDAGNNEIHAVESIILDGSFTADTWHYSGGINATAPANTVKVQALVLYIQPDADGGAGHVDDVAFGEAGTVPTEKTSWGKIKSMVK
ncbi:MAG TPA: hypothetical protein VKO43_04310 [Candidatus Krumholzibacteriaceae bacterium]|nr:hypothetical protein [Candidatus Krumholzibacteriaceae bacterium]